MCFKEFFFNEVWIISIICYCNLIVFLGCCFEIENVMFVCEYMFNGSFYDVFFVREILFDWV